MLKDPSTPSGKMEILPASSLNDSLDQRAQLVSDALLGSHSASPTPTASASSAPSAVIQQKEEAILEIQNSLLHKVSQKVASKKGKNAAIAPMVVGGVLAAVGTVLNLTGVGLLVGTPILMAGVALCAFSMTSFVLLMRKKFKDDRTIQALELDKQKEAQREANVEKIKNIEQQTGLKELTTPDILAAQIVFHEQCTPAQRKQVIQAFYNLYKVEANRPVMDVIAWNLLHSNRPLTFYNAPLAHKADIGIPPNSAGYYRDGEHIAFTDDGKLEANLIHEMTHAAIDIVIGNEAKSYEKTKASKKAYQAAVEGFKKNHHKALTEHEQAAAAEFSEPFTHEIYHTKKDWKKELDPRTAEILHLFGGNDASLRHLYPGLSDNFEKLGNRCRQFLKAKHYVPVPVTETAKKTEDNVGVNEVAQAVFYRAQYLALGDAMTALGTADAKKELVSVIQKAANKHNVDFSFLYQLGQREAIEQFCDTCAKAYKQCFQKRFRHEPTFDAAKLGKDFDNILDSAMQALVNVPLQAFQKNSNEFIERYTTVAPKNDAAATSYIKAHTIIKSHITDKVSLTPFEEACNNQLWLVAFNGDVKQAQKLLDKGAKVDGENPQSITAPLIYAAKNGHLEIVKCLIAAGADPNSKQVNNIGDSAFNLAAANGHFDIVKFLAGNGADIHATNKMGGTALTMAIAYDGQPEMIKWLVDQGVALPKHVTMAIYEKHLPACRVMLAYEPEAKENMVFKTAYAETRQYQVDQIVLKDLLKSKEMPADTALAIAKAIAATSVSQETIKDWWKDQSQHLLPALSFDDFQKAHASTPMEGMQKNYEAHCISTVTASLSKLPPQPALSPPPPTKHHTDNVTRGSIRSVFIEDGKKSQTLHIEFSSKAAREHYLGTHKKELEGIGVVKQHKSLLKGSCSLDITYPKQDKDAQNAASGLLNALKAEIATSMQRTI